MTTLFAVLIPLVGIALFYASMSAGNKPVDVAISTEAPEPLTAPPGMANLVVGGGCFWCIEPLFEMLKGVSAVESGYAGGNQPNVTYAEVGTGNSGHAEVIKITYDPKVISAADLLRVFFVVHDPTTKNRQGNDVGTQYRSAVFFADDEEKALAQKIMAEIAAEKVWKDPIVTTLEPLRNYTRAEEYHQDYYKKFEAADPSQRARMNSGYCQIVIEPKVAKFRQKFLQKLKG